MAKTLPKPKSKKPQRLQSVGGYKVLPIYFEDSEAVHYLYLRKHSDQKAHPLTPADRTLFLLNLPTFATEKSIRQLFKSVAGGARVSQVWFQGKLGHDIFHRQAEEQRLVAGLEAYKRQSEEQVGGPAERGSSKKKDKGRKKGQGEAGGDEEKFKPVELRHLVKMASYAHVVFLEKAELDRVMGMVVKDKVYWPVAAAAGNDGESPLEYLGINRYLYEYRAMRPPADMLKQEVDQFVTKFEEAQYERERQMRAMRNVPDEDGFITVLPRKAARMPGMTVDEFTMVESQEQARVVVEKQKKKKELTNFYRWQRREQKRDRLVELRKKFEEDKKRIAQLKMSRRFRPY